MKKMFVHIHGHSHYSLLEGLGSPKKIIDAAKELGMDRIGIADMGNMFAVMEFYLQSHKASIKPMMGIQVNLVNDISKPNKNIVTLMIRDEIGYKNLIKISSFANTQGHSALPSIDMQNISGLTDGLVLITGGDDSLISSMILSRDSEDKILETITIYKTMFGADSVYMELTAQDYLKLPNTKIINDKLIDLSKSAGVKLLIGNDFRYIKKENKKAFEVLGNIKDGTLTDMNKSNIKGDFHLLDQAELTDLLQKNKFESDLIDQLIANNLELSERLNVSIKMGDIYFPVYLTPDSVKDMYTQHKDGLISE